MATAEFILDFCIEIIRQASNLGVSLRQFNIFKVWHVGRDNQIFIKVPELEDQSLRNMLREMIKVIPILMFKLKRLQRK